MADLEDIMVHFLLRQCPWCLYGITWTMFRMGKGGAILDGLHPGEGPRIFRNVPVQEFRHNSDHYIILGFIYSATMREHTNYVRCCTRLLLHSPTTLTREDGLFEDLCQAIPKPKLQEARKNAWISADMWRLVNTKFYIRRDPTRSQGLIQRLSCKIKLILKAVRRQQA